MEKQETADVFECTAHTELLAVSDPDLQLRQYHRRLQLPWFHGLFMRVNIYRSALNNICRGLGSAAWKTYGGRDRAHHWLKGTGTVSGSIRYRPEIQQTTGPRCRA